MTSIWEEWILQADFVTVQIMKKKTLMWELFVPGLAKDGPHAYKVRLSIVFIFVKVLSHVLSCIFL